MPNLSKYPTHGPCAHASQGGFSLIESLIAILILSFGLLGLARFQVGMLAQSTDSQARTQASAAAQELLGMVRVDLLNSACYTYPQAGTCGSAAALRQTAAWVSSLPSKGIDVPTVTLSANNQIKVKLTWKGKAFNETRSLEVSTDTRS